MTWENLEYPKKVALARVISDAILADKIIDEEEIRKYQTLVGGNSTRVLFYDAMTFPLSHAVDVLQGNSDEEQEYVSDLLNSMIISDGVCTPSEAKFQAALEYCLKHNEMHFVGGKPSRKYEIKSFRLSDLYLGKRFVFYIEDKYNHKENAEIQQNYSIISRLLASIGFQFIYIPRMAQLYKDKGREMFEGMAMFLFPEIIDTAISSAYETITRMTTADFVENYLAKKMGIDMTSVSPSLLVMLGKSNVITNHTSSIGLRYDTYANLLKINLFNDESVVQAVDKFVSDYNRRVSINHIFEYDPSNTKLLYQGMYKVFFNMVVLAKDNPTLLRVDISTKTGTVSINGRLVNLNTAPASLCVLIIWASIMGDSRGIPKYDCATEEQKEYWQQKYQQIYAIMKNDPQGVYEPRPIYNTIKNRYSELKRLFGETTDVRIFGEETCDAQKYIRFVMSAANVYVDNRPMKDDPVWVNL